MDPGEYSLTWKRFLNITAKTHYLSLFFKGFKHTALIFSSFPGKIQNARESLEFLKIFDENSIKTIEFLTIIGNSYF